MDGQTDGHADISADGLTDGQADRNCKGKVSPQLQIAHEGQVAMNKLQELHALVSRWTLLLLVLYVVTLANPGLFVISLTLRLGVDICKDF